MPPYCWLPFLSTHKHTFFPGLNISLDMASSVLFGIMRRKCFETKWGEENNKATHIMLLLTLTAIRQRNDLPREGIEGLSLDVLRIWSIQYLRDQHKMGGGEQVTNRKKKERKNPTHFLLQLKDITNDPRGREQNLGPEPKNMKQHFYPAIGNKQIQSQKQQLFF